MKATSRIFAVLAILFGAYFIANLPELYARVKLDRQNVGLSRYAFERTPEVVLVGSSMTFRVYEHYFSIPVRNLSVGGGSPLTGLSIIASYEKLPKLILVEINIMSRPVDRVVAAQFGTNPFESYRWFRPARAVISAIYYRLKFNPETEHIRQLLKIEPQDYDISQSVNDTVREYEAIDWNPPMRPNVAELQRQIQAIEARGSRVLLFELPSPPRIRDTPYVKTVSALVREAFPKPERWIDVSDPHSLLRWIDASHMDERSAIMVAKQIEDQIIRRM